MRLVGLLLGIVLAFGLSAYVADKVMTADHKELRQTLNVLTTSSTTSASTAPGAAPAGGSGAAPSTSSAPTSATGPVAAARAVACAADRTAITQAEGAYQALHDTYTDLAGLRAARLLEGDAATGASWRLTVAPDGSTFSLTGTGACAGR